MSRPWSATARSCPRSMPGSGPPTAAPPPASVPPAPVHGAPARPGCRPPHASPRPSARSSSTGCARPLPNEGCGVLVADRVAEDGGVPNALRGHAQRGRVALPLPDGPRWSSCELLLEIDDARRGRVGHRPFARGLAAVSLADRHRPGGVSPRPSTCWRRSPSSRPSCAPGPSSTAPSTRSCSSGPELVVGRASGSGVHSAPNPRGE